MASNGESKLYSLFKSGLLSDVKVRCQGKEWELHKCVLAIHSPFFEKAFCGQFQEASTNHIELHDDDTILLEYLFGYMYKPTGIDVFHTQIYDEEISSFCIGKCLGLYALADKYQVDDLKRIAKSRATHMINDVVDHMYTAGELQDLAAVKRLIKIIDSIYSTAPPNDRSLRLTVAEACSPHRAGLLMHDRFKAYVEGNATFCFDLLEQSSEYERLDCYNENCVAEGIVVQLADSANFDYCPSCGKDTLIDGS